MGGGGGTKSSSKSYSGSAQKWATPFARTGASSVQSVFDQNQPGLQAMTNLAQKDLVPSLMEKFRQTGQTAGQGNDWNSRVLSGEFLEGNPYLEQIIGQSRRGVMDAANSNFSLSGRYGSGAHNQVLGRELADMESQMRFQNYGTEMDRMGQTALAAQGANVADNTQLLASLGLAAELPQTGTNNLANALGALFNGGSTKSTSSTSGPGLLGGLLGAGASIGSALIAKCDARLKENITLNHVDPDGLAYYDFTYKPGFGLPEGKMVNLPMAQDVAVLRPHALGPVVDGFMTIYPGKL